MSSTFQKPASKVVAAIKGLVREMAPIVLFFFLAFMVIFLIFKFFAAQYSVEFSATTRAAVGALILGKVIPMLEWAQSRYRFDTHRPAVLIVCKTFVYGLIVGVIAISEKIFHGFRETGNFHGAMDIVIANASLDRSLGIILLFCLVVGSFLVLQQINRAMGKGALVRLFFSPPLGSSKESLS